MREIDRRGLNAAESGVATRPAPPARLAGTGARRASRRASGMVDWLFQQALANPPAGPPVEVSGAALERDLAAVPPAPADVAMTVVGGEAVLAPREATGDDLLLAPGGTREAAERRDNARVHDVLGFFR